MPAPEVAVAYVSIVPSLQGFQQTLQREVVGPSGRAGDDAGAAMGSRMSGALKAGAVGAGLAVGAIIAKGLTEAIDQANISSKLQAQLGASGKDAAKYGKVAGQLYAKGVTENFQAGADAIKSIMQAGIAPPGATTKQLAEIATKASDLANVFGQDLEKATNAVSQLMRTGLAKNSSEAFDLITKGMQSGANKADDLLDTLNEYSVQFKRAGLDGSTAMGLINQAVKAGARDSDQAADAIGQFGERALAGGKAVDDAYKSIGLSSKDMAAKIGAGGETAKGALGKTLDALRGTKDETVKLNAAAALFGDPANIMGDSLYAMNTASAAASGGFDKAAGAAKNVGDSIRSGPMYEIQTFTRTLKQGLVETLGAFVIPALIKLIGTVRDVASAAVTGFNWVRDIAPYVAPFAILIGGLTLALNASAIATGLASAVFSVYRATILIGTAVTGGFTAAQALLNSVMALNPFVLVAIVLAALVAGIVIAYKRSETFRAIVQAAWKGIQTAVSFAWNSVLKPVFGWLVTAVKAVGSSFSWLYANAIRPAMNAVKTVISAVWNSGIKPVFDRFKSLVGTLGGSFRTAVSAIKTAWDKVGEIAKKPVKFIVDTVYNKGIVRVWNLVAKAFGAPTLNTMAFAKGGILPGYTPGRDPHTFYSATGGALSLSGGEAIMRPEVTRAMGAGTINGLNAAARTGGVSGVRAALGGPSQAFADGGIFKWIGNALQGAGSAAWNKVKAGASWLKDGLESSARAGMNSLINPLIAKIPGSATLYGKAISGVPAKMMDALFGYSKKSDSKMVAGGIGGKGSADALKWARAQNGKPYVWGGVGPGGFDCSGFMSAIQNVITGKAANRRVWATGAFSGNTAPAGWVKGMKAPFMVGITNAGVGHTAGTLNGVNVESSGGRGVHLGAGARGYNNSMFPAWYGYQPSKIGAFAAGGKAKAGETAWVGEKGPELVTFGGASTVYPHNVSMRLAASGIGGFAKGTTNAQRAAAKAHAQQVSRLKSVNKVLDTLGSTLKKKFVGSAKDIAAAGTTLNKSVKTLRTNGQITAAQSKKAQATTNALTKAQGSKANQLATVQANLKAGKEYATKTRDDLLSKGTLGALGSNTAQGAVLAMRQTATQMRAFSTDLGIARKRGLSTDLVGQLADMGFASGGTLARSIANDPGTISSLNASWKAMTATAGGIGNSIADTMFDSGKNAGKGFLTGLKSQEGALVKAMADAAKKAVTAIGNTLAGKKATHDSGGFLMPGATMAVNATGKPEPVLTSQQWANVSTLASRGGSGGLQPGDRLVLATGSGTDFEVYVDRRADDRIHTGLTSPASLGRTM